MESVHRLQYDLHELRNDTLMSGNVQQSGNITPGHLAAWGAPGVIVAK